MRLGEGEKDHPLLIGTTPVPGNKPPPAALTRHSHDRSGDHPGHHRGGGGSSDASPQPAGPQWPQPCPTPPRAPHWLGGRAPAHWGGVGGACVAISAGREEVRAGRCGKGSSLASSPRTYLGSSGVFPRHPTRIQPLQRTRKREEHKEVVKIAVRHLYPLLTSSV